MRVRYLCLFLLLFILSSCVNPVDQNKSTELAISISEVVCGDGVAEFPESCQTCPDDAGLCEAEAVCGDGVAEFPETCMTCPSDAGICLLSPIPES